MNTETTASGLFTVAQDAAWSIVLKHACGFRSQDKNGTAHKYSGVVRSTDLLPGLSRFVAVDLKVIQGHNMVKRLTKSPHPSDSPEHGN